MFVSERNGRSMAVSDRGFSGKPVSCFRSLNLHHFAVQLRA